MIYYAIVCALIVRKLKKKAILCTAKICGLTFAVALKINFVFFLFELKHFYVSRKLC